MGVILPENVSVLHLMPFPLEPGHFHLVSVVPVLCSPKIVIIVQVFSLPHVAFQREIYLEFQIAYYEKH